jgi:hypothetical protein
MKRLVVLSLLLVLVHFLVVFDASADPRMEINDDFCHFILDPLDTDNEVFVADCGCKITVAENLAGSGNQIIECGEYMASGYAKVKMRMPEAAAPPPVSFTYADTGTPSNMVDSNGIQYESYNWKSTIQVRPLNRDGYVRVIYTLDCRSNRERNKKD